MPPSQKGTPFKRKDIAKAFFDLDLSDAGPLNAGKTPKPPHCDPPVASQSLAINNAKGNNKATLLTLPAEIRLRIYDRLLVSRFDPEQNPSWAVENSDQKMVMLDMVRAPQYRTMEPGILQTCKQIYHEANSILYSQNIFHISEPEQMFRLIEQIGLMNVKFVKSLYVWVPWNAELSPWLSLLYILAEEVNGLRYIELGWGVNCEFPWELERGVEERGLGDSLHFVRALGKIQGLEKLVIEGYYAKHWPAYLEERMGVRVRAKYGHYLELRDGDLNDEELEDEKFKRESNEKELQRFREYQRGTEDLIP
jgi:hypothetical protein